MNPLPLIAAVLFQYQALTGPISIPAAAPDLSWTPTYPSRTAAADRVHPGASTTVTPVIVQPVADSPAPSATGLIRPLRKIQYQALASPVLVPATSAEVITLDKWEP